MPYRTIRWRLLCPGIDPRRKNPNPDNLPIATKFIGNFINDILQIKNAWGNGVAWRGEMAWHDAGKWRKQLQEQWYFKNKVPKSMGKILFE